MEYMSGGFPTMAHTLTICPYHSKVLMDFNFIKLLLKPWILVIDVSHTDIQGANSSQGVGESPILCGGKMISHSSA